MFAVMIGLGLILAEYSSPEEDLRTAEALFQFAQTKRDNPAVAREWYRKAAEGYAFLARSYRNADLYRNLGNASLLADDIPQAILAYRRGLTLAPNDWVMREHLAHARAQVAYPQGDLGHPPADSLPPWLPRLGSGPCLAGGLLAYLGGCVALTRWFMTRHRRLFVLGVILLAAGVLGVGLGGWLAWGEREESRHPLVVVAQDNVLLRSGNGLSYPARYDAALNRGVEARLVLRRDDWLKVEFGGGETGWLPRSAVLVDE
jgi:tetratricopeptide (TPR) repeat protein